MSCGYNPEEYGAQCHRCPLRKDEAAGPVAPEYHETAEFIVVGDAPEDAEITEGRPFVGPDNYILTKTLAQVGVKRQHAHWTLAVLCQPPNNDMKRYLAKIQSRNSAIKRENVTREEQGLDPLPLIPTPQECCRPRLAYEVKLHKNILTLGGSALRAVTGATASILELRGGTMHGPLTYDEGTNTLRLLKNDTIHEDVSPDAVKCLPTVSPTFTRFAKKWTEPFKVDLARAVRWFRGQNDWKPPEIVYQPDAETLREFLATLDFPTYDLETDGIEPTAAKIRCIGIGSAEKVHLVGLLSKDGATRFYSPMEELRILAVLRDVFRDPTRYKVGHNSGSYDRICVRHQWHKTAWELIDGMLNEVAFLHGAESDAYREAEAQIRAIWPDDRETLVDVWPNLDTILLHRLVASELPHRLSFVGSMYTNAPSWKCYDGETEVLTERGWVPFPALQRGEPVAQWEDGKIQFVQPRAYVDQPYAGPMWRLKSQALDLLVTPDHKMVYRDRHRGKIQFAPVQDLPSEVEIPHTGILHREENAPSLSPAFIQFLVAVQADGSWVRTAIDFGFTKTRKIDRLLQILDTLGIPYRCKKTGTKNPRTRIWVLDHPLVQQARELLTDKKVFGPWLLQWPLAARLALLDELPFWDGTKGAEHTNYNSVEPENVAILQACAVLSGRPARMALISEPEGKSRAGYRLSLPSSLDRSRCWSRFQAHHRTQEMYAGRIYCVSVPSGYIVVRRGGKVTVSGNTDRAGRKIAFDAESDVQLHEYCSLDVSQTATVMPILYDLTHKGGQDHLIEDDHQIQEICTAMHQAGMYIDQPLRAKYEKEQLKEIVALRDTLRRAAGNPSLNPGSTHQLRRLLYEEWKLKPILDDKLAYTLSGDPSTADPAIRGCLALRSLPENQIIFLKALRNYRAVQKKLGTYTAKLRPQSEDITGMGWDADELAEEFGFDVSEKTLEGADFFEAASRLFEDKEYSRKGIVWPDGRMRPGYNAHVATCVTPDTWVLGENGLFQVASLVPLYGPPQTEVPASNLVLHDGNTFHPVSHLQNPGICSTKTARLSLGITLTGTPHHRIRVAATPKFSWQDSAGKWHPSEPESIWRRLDALSTADYVLVPFGMDVWAKKAASLPAFTVPTQRTNAHLIQPPTTATEDLAYFVGVYNADGSLHDANGSFAIRLSDTRGRYTEVLLPILRRLFGDLPVRSTPGEGVAITGIALADWAEAIGLRRKITNKSIPPWLLACPRSYAEAYLRGLSRDAFVGVNGGTTVYWRYTGTEQLCREVQMLLLNMGVVGGLKDARTARSPNTWCLFVTGQEDIGQLSTILGFQIPATEEGDTSQRRPKYIRRGNHLWLRVLSAEDGGEQQVYDVTIPETHQFWANGTVSHNTGRLSSSKPMNAQNFPKDLRKLIRAQPGHLLVGADADQLELRIAAARWACPLYLGAFAADADPHSMTAAGVFGDDFLNAPGWPEGDRILVNGFRVPRNGAKFASGSLAERCRKLAKIVQYLSQYGGSPEAGLQALQQTEDDKGELIYLHFQLRQYRQMHQSWLQSAKEFPLGWQKEVAFFRKYGFIQEPVARRRRLMADGEDFNAIVNFPIQGAASSLMNRAMIAIYKEIPLHKWGPGTGIITMTHDALVVECPDDGVEITQDAKGKYHYKVSPGSPAAFVASVIESAMNQKDASLPGVSFTASADFAMTWDKVG